MWTQNWRDTIWSEIGQPWDVLVIGGGITGAGILRETTRLGLRTLLIEQRDFAWGASSRSSKFVHGGLRYLKEGKPQVTRQAVKEREILLKEGGGLVQPIGFLFPTYKGCSPGPWGFHFLLSVYELLGSRRTYQHYHAEAFQLLVPHIAHTGLTGGFRCDEAQTDDARLVLRLLREAVQAGGRALNYVCAEELLWENDRVVGVWLHDKELARRAEVRAKVVINATGVWADRLRSQVNGQARLRPLRGSHLIFPAWRFPVPQDVSFPHPFDHRPVSISPWESVTLVGTTDIDDAQSLDDEPRIQAEEVAYLMAAVEHQFPTLNLTLEDVLASFSGVRPVIGTGKTPPSKEGRDHVVWEEKGLLTVTGGKLTTFRLMAMDTLKALQARQPQLPIVHERALVFNAVTVKESELEHLGKGVRRRLLSRYGAETRDLLARAHSDELEPIPGTEILWAELRWAAHAEGVGHLDDLLLRRVRLGLVLPYGGKVHLPAIRAICQAELGWSDERWKQEEEAYLALIRTSYSLPHPSTVVAHSSESIHIT